METDYLVVGCGATALAFVDTLLDETDAHITIVDRHAAPGGHWNDAYSFVGLHQPSAYYGVNSTELGNRRKDSAGPNEGLYELASGSEIVAYYDRLMQQRLLPSGRVRYLPMSDWQGEGRVVSLLSGAVTEVQVRKRIVDSTFGSPHVPSTHRPGFGVAEGVRVATPNDLPRLWLRLDDGPAPKDFCIIGAGKTAMDAGVWLLRQGVPADRVHWVMPRDSWIQNRLHTQPGIEFFHHSIGGEANKMAAFAESATIDEVFLRLEEAGQMLRLDRNHRPSMFHYATISTGELELLRTIPNVIRQGRVRTIERDALVMESGDRVPMPAGTLYIDCTASAVALAHLPTQPLFQEKRIVLQLLRAPLITLSAAVAAYVEAHESDDASRNALCTPVPFPRDLAGYARSTLGSLSNQLRWSQHEGLRRWLRASRLDGFGGMVAAIDKDDAERQAVVARLRSVTMAAAQNMPRLMKAQSA